MTDQLDLDGLERLAKAATPGPWEMKADGYGGFDVEHGDDATGGWIVEAMRPESDAAYIAAANPATILALISQAREAERMRGAGWQLADDVPVWSDGIVTDGEHTALAQKAEADYGGTYWATDEGEGCLEWEPNHFIALAPATGGGE